MTTKFISGMGQKLAFIASGPLFDWAIQGYRRLLLLKLAKFENDNSQEPLNEFGPILCHRIPRMKLLQYFTN